MDPTYRPKRLPVPLTHEELERAKEHLKRLEEIAVREEARWRKEKRSEE